MKFQLLGETWTIKRGTLPEDYGLCDWETKTITFDERMPERKALEILIHELMHATNWYIPEKHIEQAAKEWARLIKRFIAEGSTVGDRPKPRRT